MIRPQLRRLTYVLTAAVSLFYFCWYCKRNSANFIFSFKLTWKSASKYQKIYPNGEMEWYQRNKNSKWGEGKRLWLPISWKDMCAILSAQALLLSWETKTSPRNSDSQTSTKRPGDCISLRNEVSQSPHNLAPSHLTLHLSPTTLVYEFCIPAKLACLSFHKYAVCPSDFPSAYPPPVWMPFESPSYKG